jgi:Flp pilus assembly pilin Flp
MVSFSSQGQGLLEYGLVIVFVAIVVIILLVIFGGSVGNLFSNIVANV